MISWWQLRPTWNWVKFLLKQVPHKSINSSVLRSWGQRNGDWPFNLCNLIKMKKFDNNNNYPLPKSGLTWVHNFILYLEKSCLLPLIAVGDFCIFSGNYTQALEDFQECLKLQQKHLDSDSRLLAETHYQLGLTYSLNLEYCKAIEELKNSISVIKSRLGEQRWQHCLHSAHFISHVVKVTTDGLSVWAV